VDTKSTLEERLETLKDLNRNRFDFVLAYSNHGDVRNALKEIGMSSSWYYKFTTEERAELEALGNELHRETTLRAWYILASAAPEAARVKLDGLKDKNGWIRQAAASDILERTTKKLPAKSKVELDAKVNIYSEQAEQILERVYGNKPDNT
jgi:hypothetical protein